MPQPPAPTARSFSRSSKTNDASPADGAAADGSFVAVGEVGARLLVPAEALPPAAEDEFYWHEVVGFQVETTAGEPLGRIVDVFHTGTSDVWTVRGENKREVMIPVIQDVVRVLDRSARRAV